MSNLRTPPSKISKQHSIASGYSGYNPFDSDSEEESSHKPSRASSAPVISKAKNRTSDFGECRENLLEPSSSFYPGSSAAKNRYKNDFHDSGGIENQSVQELENFAVFKAKETTQQVNGCLRIAEEIREDASRTLVTLHQQGEKIYRTHATAAGIEQDLSRGEKLLGSLGGIFSKKWIPKMTRQISGPQPRRGDLFARKGSDIDQRQKLGLSAPLPRSNPRQFSSEPTTAIEKVEMEIEKQDDALSDLSNLLGELKNMALDMGSEIERHTAAVGHMQYDVDELSYRVKGANQRARSLLRK